ncbi:hypothetical protein ATY77_00805 [Rhizobium sp. R634]|nr:hypothetical protein ATY77_00805 [Rhizobium sp. R634]
MALVRAPGTGTREMWNRAADGRRSWRLPPAAALPRELLKPRQRAPSLEALAASKCRRKSAPHECQMTGMFRSFSAGATAPRR